jgi:hypothetical protein
VSKAGNFTIDVEGPYPCWCSIRHDDFADTAIKISHKELSDLQYAVTKAMQEARLKLGRDAVEV